MQQILALAVAAVFDPVLAGAAALMLLLPNPKRMMFGFVLGALLTSIPIGLVIVFALQGSKAVSTTKHKIDPALNISVGLVVLVICVMVATGLWQQLSDRRNKRKGPPKDKGPSRMQRALDKGSPKLTFCVGAVYEAMPSVIFLAAMHAIVKVNTRTVPTVALVVLICLAQLALVLLPLISFVVAPTWTPNALARAKAWLTRDSRKLTVVATAVIGIWLLVRGLVAL